MGVASSVANDVIMRTGVASAVGATRHNQNDGIMIIAGYMMIWRLATCGHGLQLSSYYGRPA